MSEEIKHVGITILVLILLMVAIYYPLAKSKETERKMSIERRLKKEVICRKRKFHNLSYENTWFDTDYKGRKKIQAKCVDCYFFKEMTIEESEVFHAGNEAYK